MASPEAEEFAALLRGTPKMVEISVEHAECAEVYEDDDLAFARARHATSGITADLYAALAAADSLGSVLDDAAAELVTSARCDHAATTGP